MRDAGLCFLKDNFYAIASCTAGYIVAVTGAVKCDGGEEAFVEVVA